MKHIIAILLITRLTFNIVHAQSNEVMAKSYFLKTQQAYNEGENQHALENLDRTVEYLEDRSLLC